MNKLTIANCDKLLNESIAQMVLDGYIEDIDKDEAIAVVTAYKNTL